MTEEETPPGNIVKTMLTLYSRALAIAEDPDNSPTEANDFVRDVETLITSLGEMHKTFMTLVCSDGGKRDPGDE